MLLRRALSASAVIGLALLGVGLVAAPAAAATVTVTSTADDGSGGVTLREALAAAGPGDTIDFDATVFSTPQTINLNNSSLLITESVTITGPGEDLLTVQRQNDAFGYALFLLNPPAQSTDPIDLTITGMTMDRSATTSNAFALGSAVAAFGNSNLRNLTLRDVTIEDQHSTGTGGGVNIESISGAVNFENVVVQDSIADSDGGGTYIVGAPTSVTVTGGAFLRNTAADTSYAGAVYLRGVTGVTSFTGTEFSENSAGHGGAMRFEDVGTVDIDSSVFFLNSADDSGGAIGLGMTAGYGAVTITNTRFIGNTAENGYGGAIFTDGSNDEPFTIARSTFDGNTAISNDDDGAKGGALYVNEVDELFTIDSSTFTRNFVGKIEAETTSGHGTSVAVNSIDDEEESLFFIVNSTFDEDLTDFSGPEMIYVEQNNGAFSIKYSTLVGFLPVYVTNPEPGDSTVASTIVQSGAGQPDLYNEDDPFQVEYSILSKPHEPLNVIDLGNNQFSTDALLGILQNNGGPTETRMPASNSPALNKGGPSLGAPDWDQRFEGYPRIVGLLDVGAVEIPAALPATGGSVPLWIPIVGGAVLLLGAGAFVFSMLARRRAS